MAKYLRTLFKSWIMKSYLLQILSVTRLYKIDFRHEYFKIDSSAHFAVDENAGPPLPLSAAKWANEVHPC